MIKPFEKLFWFAAVSSLSLFGHKAAIAKNAKTEWFSEIDESDIVLSSSMEDDADEHQTKDVEDDASKPLRMQDLIDQGRVGDLSMNQASIYKDQFGQSWFIKKGISKGILASHVSANLLEFLYPGRFAQSRLIEGKPDRIASKMIPGFSSLKAVLVSGCRFDGSTICNKTVRGHEEVVSLIEFLGLGDYHAGNVGVIEDDNSYRVTMVDYDSSLDRSLDNFLWRGPCDLPPIPRGAETQFMNQDSAMTAAYQKIVNMTNEQIRSIIWNSIDDLNSNGLSFGEEIRIKLYNKLLESRDRIHHKIQSQIIIQAVLDDDIEAVKAFLEERLVNSIFDYQGTSLIDIAQEKGSDAMKALIQETLVKHSIQYPNTVYCDEDFHLMKAVKQGNIALAQSLIAAKANINADSSLLWHAVEAGDFGMVNLLLSQSNFDIESQDYIEGVPRRSFFANAVYLNNAEMVQLLLRDPRLGPNWFAKNGPVNFTGLQVAIQNNNLPMIRLLLEHPDIDVNLSSDQKNSPLIIAVENRNLEAMELLLDHPGINVNSSSDPLIKIAVENDNLKALKVLLTYPGIDVNLGNPLMLAISKSNFEAIKLLLDHPDIDVNLSGAKGNTPLVAIFIELTLNSRKQEVLKKSLEIMKLLLDHPGILVDLNQLRQSDPFYNRTSELFSNLHASELVEAYLKKNATLSQRIKYYFTGKW